MDNPICIIDDENDFLDSAGRGLFMCGFKNVHLESDPRKAVDLFAQNDGFAVAMIDITMPGMDGLELLGIIKTYSPNTECIMITAIDEARVAVECLKKGAYDYLVKPVSRDDLARVVGRALERNSWPGPLEPGIFPGTWGRERLRQGPARRAARKPLSRLKKWKNPTSLRCMIIRIGTRVKAPGYSA